MKFDLTAFEEVDTSSLIQVTGGYYGTGGGYVSDSYVQQNSQNYTPTNGSVYGYNSNGTAKSPPPGGIDYTKSSQLGYVVYAPGPRYLTAEELSIAKRIFGETIDYSKVKINTGEGMDLFSALLTGVSDAAVTLGDTINFPNYSSTNTTKLDLTKPEHVAWFVHEMAHVSQFQTNGWSYVFQSVVEQTFDGKAAYQYSLTSGKSYTQYGIEQQAQIVADYYSGNYTSAQKPYLDSLITSQGWNVLP